MKDYICIFAFLLAAAGATSALTGCETKVTQTSSGGGTPVVVVDAEPAK